MAWADALPAAEDLGVGLTGRLASSVNRCDMVCRNWSGFQA
jgi:hypothetical protein